MVYSLVIILIPSEIVVIKIEGYNERLEPENQGNVLLIFMQWQN